MKKIASALRVETAAPAQRGRLPLLLVLTVLNFLNYADRQIVYGMFTLIGDDLQLNSFQLGLLGTVNLSVFALATLTTAPLMRWLGARPVLMLGAVVWTLATFGSALAPSYGALLAFRAIVGIGEGMYGPCANALLCAAALPYKKGRALSIFNAGMSLGGMTGMVLGNAIGPIIGWRHALFIAGVPGLLLPLTLLSVKLPPPHAEPAKFPVAAYLTHPTFLLAIGGGILGSFGSSALIAWAQMLLVVDHAFTPNFASVFMCGVGIVGGVGGVLAGGHLGDAASRRVRGGHALTVGASFLLAAIPGLASLTAASQLVFMALCALTVFFLSIYNGPAAAIVDELVPPQHAAAAQGVFLFCIHLFGNTPAPAAVGWVIDRLKDAQIEMPVGAALQFAMIVVAVSGLLFVMVARRQRR